MFQFGIDAYAPLSAISLYDQIGESPQSALWMDALDAMIRNGCLPPTPTKQSSVRAHSPGDWFRYPSGYRKNW